jgi:rhodanese-related sulfurtransferase
MNYRFLIASLLCVFVTTASTVLGGQVDPTSIPESKRTTLGLYLDSTEVPAFLFGKSGKVLFVDVRTRAELMLVGVPTIIDANVPVRIGPSDIFDEQKHAFKLEPNPGFVAEVDRRLAQKNLARTDAVVVMCRSGDRSAMAANLLHKAGYTQVYSVVDGFEGDIAREGPDAGHPVVNGWKNKKLPWTYVLDKEKLFGASDR